MYSTVSQLVIHCGFTDHAKGEVVTKFLKILHCLESQDDIQSSIRLNPDKISEKIEGFIEENDLLYNNLLVGMEQMAVMIGKQNGVVQKILERQTSNQNANVCRAPCHHCAVHKLAASKAMNDFALIVRFKKTGFQNFMIFTPEVLRATNFLKGFKIALGKLLDPFETSWLAHGKCELTFQR